MMKSGKVTSDNSMKRLDRIDRSDNSMKRLDRIDRSHKQYIPVRHSIVKDDFSQTYQGGY